MLRSALVTVALFTASGLQGAAQSDPCATISRGAEISAIGAFSNMRYTGEHAYGETVLLWRAGNCLFGLFESAQGLQGDTPLGELQQVTYDPGSGALRFAAKLTMGVVAAPAPPREQPSRDLFTFEGTLGPSRVAGTLAHATQLEPKPPARSVVLLASARDTELLRGSATYGAWRLKWEPILKRRGPKW